MCKETNDGSSGRKSGDPTTASAHGGVSQSSRILSLTFSEKDNFQLMDLLNAIPDGVLLVDPTGMIVLANLQACEMFGYAQEELVSQPVDLLLPVVLRENHVKQRADFFEDPQRRRMGERELSGLRKDGSELYVDISLGPLMFGKQMVACAVVRDVTADKLTQAALRDAEALVRLLLDSTFEAIYGLDMQGNATFCNRACVELLGYENPEDLLGKNMHDLIHHTRPDGSPYPVQECKIYEAFSKGVGTHVKDEVLWKSDGSSFPAEYRSLPVRHEGELVGSVVTFSDSTERLRVEDELRGKQEELTHVARLSMLGEMAAGLAHELNQPLTAMSALAEGALLRIDRGTLTQEDFVSVCRRIAADAQRAGEIIQRLRNFVQKRKTERHRVDLNLLINDVIEFVTSDVRQSGVSIQTVLADDLRRVEVDPVEIQQVIVNLIRNATDALGHCRPEDRRIVITTRSIDRAAEVMVSDSGPGIPQDLVDQIFEPFYTSKKGGLGIGLGICKSIIETHRGRIWLGENSSHGAVLHFSLPTES